MSLNTMQPSDKLAKLPAQDLVSLPLPQDGYEFGYGNLEDEGEIHLRNYWRAIRKRFWMVVGFTLLGAMLTAIYMARKPNIYEAQARVQVNLENAATSGASGKSGAVVVSNQVTDPAYFNTQLQILSGPGLLRRVAKTLDLENNAAFLKTGRETRRSTWQSIVAMVGLGRKDADQDSASTEVPRTEKVAPASSREDLVEAKRLEPFVTLLSKNLKIEPVVEKRVGIVKDTRLIDIRYTHSDPQLAAKIVNAVADTYTLQNLERRTETTVNAGDLLLKRIAELQSEIRAGEERLINYAKNHQILSLDPSQNTVVDRLAGLNRQLLEAENERKMAEASYRAALRPGAADAMAEENAKQIADIETKLADLRQKRANLLVENTEEWPEVKEITTQIASLEEQTKEIRRRASSAIVTNLQTKYHQAADREGSLRDAFNQQRGETLTQNEAAITYRIIQQEIETNKQLLDSMLQGSKQNDMMLAETPNNAYVVDYGIAPSEAVGPRRLLTIGLAMILSLAIGIGLALFIEYLDNSIRSVDDIVRVLRLPALAVIPSIGSIKKRGSLIPSKIAGSAKGSAALVLRNGKTSNSGNGNGYVNPQLWIHTNSRSPMAEAYRQLRTSILLSTAGRAPKTILVTSSTPAEGKTTTAVNTAISLAQTGESVVIIDADMRRPRLHTIFNLPNTKGLSHILSQDLNEMEVLQTVEKDSESGVHVLTAGMAPPNPAELLGSNQMHRLITTLEYFFKYVVIDSPPIASFTDGVLLSTMADGVLLVVHGGKTSQDVAKRARLHLQNVGARIFGVVLNRIDMHSPDYGDYYSDYYKHGYYESTDEVAVA